MGAIVDAVRSILDRIEALRDDFVLSRDPEFVSSLREADERLHARETLSVDELEAELESESDHPLPL